jgi:calcineurin-like phosphoesterase
MKKEDVLYRFQTNMPVRFEVPKSGRAVLSGFFVDIDNQTGKAISTERIYINEDYPFQA